MRRASIPVSLPVEMVKELDNLRAKLGYRSRSEVIREATRRFIEEIGETKVICVRKLTLKQAKEEILDYLKQHNSAYVSDIAEARGIDIDLAFKAVKSLERAGVIG